MTIAIGVVTFNRCALVCRTVDAVMKYTSDPFYLAVADDGSSDDTCERMLSQAITTISGVNRGIAWNKNRLLYAFKNYTDADIFILLEDDTLPAAFGWQKAWQDAVDKFGYVTHAHPKVMDAVLSGSGTANDPYACTKITSQCSAVSAQAVQKVGYFDSRFRGYGIEDGEWTTRLRRQGFGVAMAIVNGRQVKANYMIDGDVHTSKSDSYRDNENVAKNRALYEKIKNDPIPRAPWCSKEEKVALIAEIESALEKTPLLMRNPSAGSERLQVLR